LPALERHLRVQRSARVFVLGTPGAATTELWIACHGYGQLGAGFAQALEPLEHDSRVIVVPEALNRFYLGDPHKLHGPDSPVGATWMTREDREREIADYVEYLDLVTSTIVREAGARVPPAIVALGFSQGVATVCRWASMGRTTVQRLILWGGTLPQDLPSDGGDRLFKGAELTMVVGRKDFFVSPVALGKNQADLDARGIPAKVIRFEGGHALNSETLRLLASNQ
jgi:predicted esterase